MDMTAQRAIVRVDAGPGPYPCPECGTPGPRYDGKARRWVIWTRCSLRPEVPRVECATHGPRTPGAVAEPGSAHAEHFKTAIYFHYRGLDLDPHETR